MTHEAPPKDPMPQAKAPSRGRDIGPPRYQSADWGAFPSQLQADEGTLLTARRGKALPQTPEPTRTALPRVGLALSGGGIRSATFSLGILQALARLKRLTRVDYLSTVSGGGYVGTFLGALYQSREPSPTKSPLVTLKDPETVQDQLLAGRDLPLRFLRENGRYLTPGGSGDALQAGGVTLRNFASLHLVLGLFALMVFLGMDLLRLPLSGLAGRLPAALQNLAAGQGIAWHLWWSPWVLFPVAVTALWVVPTAWAYWLVHESGSGNAGWHPLLTVGLLGLFAAWGMGPGAHLLPALDLALLFGDRSESVCTAVAGLSVLTLGCYGVARAMALWRNRQDLEPDEDRILGPRRRLSEWLRAGLFLTLLGLYAALVDSLAQSAYAVVIHGTVEKGGVNWGNLAGLGRWLALVGAPLSFLVAKGRTIVTFMEKRILPKEGSPSVPWGLVAGLAAFVLGTGILLAVAFTEKGIAWGWRSPVAGQGDVYARILPPDPKEAAVKAGNPAPAATGLAAPGAPAPTPPPETAPTSPAAISLGALCLAFGITFALSLAVGRTYEFLNLSSLGPYYVSMLTRAYLGASNWVRHAERKSPTFVVAGDDIPGPSYAPHEAGGPLHLINVCLNETFGGESDVNQRDRHGLGLAVGPLSYSVGVNHHALRVRDTRKAAQGGLPKTAFGVFHVKGDTFQPEALSIGRWMGISGAAASTGMGMRTSPGLSLLCGVFNVRLGYWWDSGISSRDREGTGWSLRWSSLPRFLFPVQCHILDEFAAHFPGTAHSKWYLSDGGHFENLGAYELIRRRVPLMIVVDASADPGYAFEDLDNLVRKARTDFGAEIAFLDTKELASLKATSGADGWQYLGPLDQLRRGKEQEGTFHPDPTGVSQVHGALARVRYDTPFPEAYLGPWERAQRQRCTFDGAWLLYIKPTLRQDGDLPLDVLRYHATHPAFPHESTSDQFFDEAQWESYRRLGEFIGLRVLGLGQEEDPTSWKAGPFWNLGPTCHAEEGKTPAADIV